MGIFTPINPREYSREKMTTITINVFDFLGRSGREILLHKDIGISRNISVKINKPVFPKFRGQKSLNHA